MCYNTYHPVIARYEAIAKLNRGDLLVQSTHVEIASYLAMTHLLFLNSF